jgi:hypothetical protein
VAAGMMKTEVLSAGAFTSCSHFRPQTYRSRQPVFT